MKTFGAIWWKGDEKYQENRWGFHSNLMTFCDLAEVNLSLGGTVFCDIEKSCSENVINACVDEVFWAPFA